MTLTMNQISRMSNASVASSHRRVGRIGRSCGRRGGDSSQQGITDDWLLWTGMSIGIEPQQCVVSADMDLVQIKEYFTA